MARGEMFILAAPSGTGKDTLICEVMSAIDGLGHSVSHTTRRARQGEVDGQDYHFVDREVFEAMIADDAFLEWAQYNHNLYGTSVVEVESRLDRGVDLLLDIEIVGTERLLERCPEAHAIFVLPPSYRALEQRLISRGLDDAEAVVERLALSLWEIERYGLFHYAIINDDLDCASQALAAIILEKRHRVARQEKSVQAVLKEFRRLSPQSG